MATDVKKVGEIPGRARAAMHNGLLKKRPSWRVQSDLKYACLAELTSPVSLCDEENRCWQILGFTCRLPQLSLDWPLSNYVFWVKAWWRTISEFGHIMVYVLSCDLCVISQCAVPLCYILLPKSQPAFWSSGSRLPEGLSNFFFGHCLLLVQNVVQKHGISQHSVQCVIKKM